VSRSEYTGDERYNDAGTTLKILDAVEQGNGKSQRMLAGEAEIALGLANAYLKRCVRKGWIKMREAPARRYLYYVTPRGFSEKARLTAEYLTNSFEMFRTARAQCDTLVERCERLEYKRIALAGAGDLAEIAALSGFNGNVEILAIVDPTSNQPRVAGIPVVRALDDIGEVDAVLLTEIRRPQEIYEALAGTFPATRILVPPLLRINPDRAAGADEAGEAAE